MRSLYQILAMTRLKTPTLYGILAFCLWFAADTARSADTDFRVRRTVTRGLDWLANSQARDGRWAAKNGAYPTAMTALAGIAMTCEGSTTTQGKYQANLRRAVDFLMSRSRKNGLLGDPKTDDRYTYGHGFAMLFLSQILGEEEDEDRRRQLVKILKRAVEFTGKAQTKAGGWGYMSAKDGDNFDEGSTTVTQIQGLRGCRNAGIRVPKEIIDRAIGYINKCSLENGGVQYSSQGGSARPAITAAAVACLYDAGNFENPRVLKQMKYCEKHLGNATLDGLGHWHYAHFYYAQVMYRAVGRKWNNSTTVANKKTTKDDKKKTPKEPSSGASPDEKNGTGQTVWDADGKKWKRYRNRIYAKILAETTETKDRKYVYWRQGYIGPVYTSSINLIILQLESAALPIYHR